MPTCAISRLPTDLEETTSLFCPGKRNSRITTGQPAELATAYVMLAAPLSSYTSGTTIVVTGGKPFYLNDDHAHLHDRMIDVQLARAALATFALDAMR